MSAAKNAWPGEQGHVPFVMPVQPTKGSVELELPLGQDGDFGVIRARS